MMSINFNHVSQFISQIRILVLSLQQQHSMQAIVPRHLRVVNGELVEAEPSGGRNGKPTVIDYVHSIRILEQHKCDHEEIIRQMQQKYYQDMKEKQEILKSMKDDQLLKDQQNLQRIMDEIAKKERELEERQMELANKEDRSSFINSRASSQDLPFTISVTGPGMMGRSEIQNRSSYGVGPDGLLSSSCCFPKRKHGHVEEMQPSKELERVATEMEKTQDALDNLTLLLNKPKKKYKFFNTNLQKIQEVLPAKKTERTSVSICSSQQERSWNEIETSIDCTATDQSRDTAEFLEDAIGDHLTLKKALVELQTSTQHQMQQMREYYENEIRIYAELLANEKVVTSKEGKLDSARSHPKSDELDTIEPIEHSEEESQMHSLFDELQETTFEEEE